MPAACLPFFPVFTRKRSIMTAGWEITLIRPKILNLLHLLLYWNHIDWWPDEASSKKTKKGWVTMCSYLAGDASGKRSLFWCRPMALGEILPTRPAWRIISASRVIDDSDKKKKEREEDHNASGKMGLWSSNYLFPSQAPDPALPSTSSVSQKSLHCSRHMLLWSDEKEKRYAHATEKNKGERFSPANHDNWRTF